MDPEEQPGLDGLNDGAWRERIGNAVRPLAAKAIASMMGESLLRAQVGEVLALRRADLSDEGVLLRRMKGSKSELRRWSDRRREAVRAAQTLHKGVISPCLLHGANGEPVASRCAGLLFEPWARLRRQARRYDAASRCTTSRRGALQTTRAITAATGRPGCGMCTSGRQKRWIVRGDF